MAVQKQNPAIQAVPRITPQGGGVPVVQNPNLYGAMVSPQATYQQGYDPLANFVGAGQIAGFKPRHSLPRAIKLTLDNSGGGAAVNYMLFDPIGAVASVLGGSFSAPTTQALTIAILKDYLQGNPILFAGFRMEAATSASQFNNQVTMYAVDLDGSINTEPLNLEDPIDGSKYNEKIQGYQFPIVVNSLVGIKVPVNAGETVYITFYPQQEFFRIR